jgi:hypothetical protein
MQFEVEGNLSAIGDQCVDVVHFFCLTGGYIAHRAQWFLATFNQLGELRKSRGAFLVRPIEAATLLMY